MAGGNIHGGSAWWKCAAQLAIQASRFRRFRARPLPPAQSVRPTFDPVLPRQAGNRTIGLEKTCGRHTGQAACGAKTGGRRASVQRAEDLWDLMIHRSFFYFRPQAFREVKTLVHS